MISTNFHAAVKLSDPRSKNFSCDLTIENLSPESIDLLSITPTTPNGIEIQETFDPSIPVHEREHKRLQAQTSQALTDYMIANNPEYLKRVKQEKSTHHNIFSNLFGEGSRAAGINIVVSSAADVERELVAIVTDDDNDSNYVRNIINNKKSRMKELENEYNVALNPQAITSINPGEIFTRTYVFDAERGLTDPKTYSIAFECRVRDKEVPKGVSRHCSISISIAPNAIVLTLYAVIAAIIGVIIKVSIPKGNETTISFPKSFDELNAPMIVASLSALIFFNVYEYTEFGARIEKRPVSWRSALLIGTLCGLFNDRILAALSGLISAG